MIKWNKLGLIIKPQKNLWWMQNYAMVPVADNIKDSIYRIYFSGRNEKNQSIIGYANIDLENLEKEPEYSIEPILKLGELGCFDDNGVTPSCIVNNNHEKYLYYIGWKPKSTTRLSLITGLAISIDNGKTFKRVSRSPILKLTDKEPFSILTGPFVLKMDNKWKMWYVSCTKWENPDLPRYHIKYAESSDGLNWKQDGIVCIDYKSNDEISTARPCVLYENGLYRMWYTYKMRDITYRIGYAESKDGINWERMDHKAGIDVSESGWDSEMIEYPYVFKYKDQKYMLYNGNGYGSNGIGLAVLNE